MTTVPGKRTEAYPPTGEVQAPQQESRQQSPAASDTTPGPTASDVGTSCEGSGDSARIVLFHSEHGPITGCECCEATVHVTWEMEVEQHERDKSTVPEDAWE